MWQRSRSELRQEEKRYDRDRNHTVGRPTRTASGHQAKLFRRRAVCGRYGALRLQGLHQAGKPFPELAGVMAIGSAVSYAVGLREAHLLSARSIRNAVLPADRIRLRLLFRGYAPINHRPSEAGEVQGALQNTGDRHVPIACSGLCVHDPHRSKTELIYWAELFGIYSFAIYGVVKIFEVSKIRADLKAHEDRREFLIV
jgi:hypothetical protein